jgi:hypothetical protein
MGPAVAAARWHSAPASRRACGATCARVDEPPDRSSAGGPAENAAQSCGRSAAAFRGAAAREARELRAHDHAGGDALPFAS